MVGVGGGCWVRGGGGQELVYREGEGVSFCWASSQRKVRITKAFFQNI